MSARDLGTPGVVPPSNQDKRQNTHQDGRQNNRKPTPTDVIVGANLKRLRRRRKISQQKIGKAVGLSFKQIRKYEAGENRISASTLYLLASVLDVEISAFYDGLPLISQATMLPIDTEAEALRTLYDLITLQHERTAILLLVQQIAGTSKAARTVSTD